LGRGYLKYLLTGPKWRVATRKMTGSIYMGFFDSADLGILSNEPTFKNPTQKSRGAYGVEFSE